MARRSRGQSRSRRSRTRHTSRYPAMKETAQIIASIGPSRGRCRQYETGIRDVEEVRVEYKSSVAREEVHDVQNQADQDQLDDPSQPFAAVLEQQPQGQGADQ